MDISPQLSRNIADRDTLFWESVGVGPRHSYRCQQCDTTCSTAANLRRHQRRGHHTHPLDRRISAPYPTLTSALEGPTAIVDHSAGTFSSSKFSRFRNKDLFKCETCGENFHRRGLLVRHMKVYPMCHYPRNNTKQARPIDDGFLDVVPLLENLKV
ncbi:hypothetical protein BDN72DRAFT_841104 [Pluteus cervinus]|uniref:Uncharacterized protein n=1 Tax=Pluteus cervinus TaxID=181527 RepID=A0ACD3AUI5_9AGAR|nr:hypothetical protein BDN72DRAFT_841104 [Pluteus cervinus]